jgi:hypothetical protein
MTVETSEVNALARQLKNGCFWQGFHVYTSWASNVACTSRTAAAIAKAEL